MYSRWIWVGYFTEEDRDKRFETSKEYPMYQLSDGESHDDESRVFANPRNFREVAAEILEHLKDPYSLDHTYELKFIGDKAEGQLGEQGMKALEGIIDLHNDLVTPLRKSSVSFKN